MVTLEIAVFSTDRIPALVPLIRYPPVRSVPKFGCLHGTAPAPSGVPRASLSRVEILIAGALAFPLSHSVCIGMDFLPAWVPQRPLHPRSLERRALHTTV